MFSLFYQMLDRLALLLHGMSVPALRRARGQGLVEYALIIALVAIVVVAALLILGPKIASTFTSISSNL